MTLKEKRYDMFLNFVKQAWEEKKKTTEIITENKKIKRIDEILSRNESVIAHKLCGAGNGGFFLTFSKKGSLTIPYNSVKIYVTPDGVKGESI
jgi:galactokinase/mevalonate kinase-like predicted kinase